MSCAAEGGGGSATQAMGGGRGKERASSGEGSCGGEPVLQVRLATIDYYMEKPKLGHDVSQSEGMGGKALSKAPVVRVFGSTPAGQKACLHLHRCFPYFFVPVPKDWPHRYDAELDCRVRQLCVSLDEAINQTAQKKAEEAGRRHSRQQAVLKACVVKGVPFYGYHPQERLWVKIYLVDPMFTKVAAGLLQAGSVMGVELQPHNEHLPYILQVMGDFNLVGMGYVNLKKVTYRTHVYVGNEEGCGRPLAAEFHEAKCGGALKGTKGEVNELPRMSTCELEIDAQPEDVLNRELVSTAELTASDRETRLAVDTLKYVHDDIKRCSERFGIAPPQRGLVDLTRTQTPRPPGMSDRFREAMLSLAEKEDAEGYRLPGTRDPRLDEFAAMSLFRPMQDNARQEGVDMVFREEPRQSTQAVVDIEGAMRRRHSAYLSQRMAASQAAGTQAGGGQGGVSQVELTPSDFELLKMILTEEYDEVKVKDDGDEVERERLDLPEFKDLKAEEKERRRQEKMDLKWAAKEEREALYMERDRVRAATQRPSEGEEGEAAGAPAQAQGEGEGRVYMDEGADVEMADESIDLQDVSDSGDSEDGGGGAAFGSSNQPQQPLAAPAAPAAPASPLPGDSFRSIPQVDGMGEGEEKGEAGRKERGEKRGGGDGGSKRKSSSSSSSKGEQSKSAQLLKKAKAKAGEQQQAGGLGAGQCPPLPESRAAGQVRRNTPSLTLEPVPSLMRRNTPSLTLEPVPSRSVASPARHTPAAAELAAAAKLEEDRAGKRKSVGKREDDAATRMPPPASGEASGSSSRNGGKGGAPSSKVASRAGSGAHREDTRRRDDVAPRPLKMHKNPSIEVEVTPSKEPRSQGSSARTHPRGEGQGRASGAAAADGALETAARRSHEVQTARSGVPSQAAPVQVGAPSPKPQQPALASSPGVPEMPSSGVPEMPSSAASPRAAQPAASPESAEAASIAPESSLAHHTTPTPVPPQASALPAASPSHAQTDGTQPFRPPPSPHTPGSAGKAPHYRPPASPQTPQQVAHTPDLGLPSAAKASPKSALKASSSLASSSSHVDLSQRSNPSVATPQRRVRLSDKGSESPAGDARWSGGKETVSDSQGSKVSTHSVGQAADGLLDKVSLEGEKAAMEKRRAAAGGARPLCSVFRPKKRPPPPKECLKESAHYQEPYYSRDEDVEANPVVFAGREFHIKSHAARFLQPFGSSPGLEAPWKREPCAKVKGGSMLRPMRPPPSYQRVASDLKKETKAAQLAAEAAGRGEGFGEMQMEIDSAGRACYKPAEHAVPEQGSQTTGSSASNQNLATQQPTHDAIREILEDRPPSPRYDEHFFGLMDRAALTSQAPLPASSQLHRTLSAGMPGASQPRRAASQAKPSRQTSAFVPRANSSHAPPPHAASGSVPAPQNAAAADPCALPSNRGSGKSEGAQVPEEEGQEQATPVEEEDAYHITVMCIEVVCSSDTSKLVSMRPDPELDEVFAVCWCVHEMSTGGRTTGIIAQPGNDRGGEGLRKAELGLPRGCLCQCVANERELFDEFEKLVGRRDPDILAGFEIQNGSIGYLMQRSEALGIRLDRGLSRCPSHPSTVETRMQFWGETNSSGLVICGRIILNSWKIIKSEVKLMSDSYNHLCFHILNKRVPDIPPHKITFWYSGKRPSGEPIPPSGDLWDRRLRAKAVCHYLERACNALDMLEAVDLLVRTCELARVFGIDFTSVITRGSQYRVESMMYRLARTQNYVMMSPSGLQVRNQRPIECIPCVMEPDSQFYTSPVCVTDFRSLYPSVIIAYNMCYCTVLGSTAVEGPGLGCDQTFQRDRGVLAASCAGGNAYASPNGSMFVSQKQREGILPRMLVEILEARVLVKKLMKSAKKGGETALYRRLNARQFALKLIANVTYGYTSASATGRMPCREVADAIVQTGRESLEGAIRMIGLPKHNAPSGVSTPAGTGSSSVQCTPAERAAWGNVSVVYGDTDSIFVHMQDMTLEEAFRVGRLIADKVTKENPPPMELELEKVYFPSFMVSKKRYVGYSYESPDQKTPALDAKGIEMVRRDSCPIIMRAQEEMIRALFDTMGDVSAAKAALVTIFQDLVRGRINVVELTFCKQIRQEYRTATLPPAAALDHKRSMQDKRAKALYKERIAYVVVTLGGLNQTLSHLGRDPSELAGSQLGLKVNVKYYVEKGIIPPCERLLKLLGADPSRWWNDTKRDYRGKPSMRKLAERELAHRANHKATMDQHFYSQQCVVCDAGSTKGVCERCMMRPQETVSALLSAKRRGEEEMQRLRRVCQDCTGCKEGVNACGSIDCPAFYERRDMEEHCKGAAMIRWGLDLVPSALDW